MITFIKRLLGIKKSNGQNEDVKVDFDVKDLKIGFILDYDMKSWEVKDVSVYTWDNFVKDLEFTIFDGKVKQYLNYESIDDAISIYWEEKVNIVWPDARKKITQHKDLSSDTFSYKNEEYHFAGEGYASVKSSKESYNMQNWLFESENEDNLISFNRYSDGLIEVYAGKRLKSHEIDNILPRK